MARIKTGYQDKQLCLTEAGARQSPCERTVANVRFWPHSAGGPPGPNKTGRVAASGVGLLRKLQRIFDLDAQIAYRALEFAVAKRELHSAQVFGAPINQRGLCPAHPVRAIR